MEPVFLATIYRWLLKQVVFRVETVQLGPAVVATMGVAAHYMQVLTITPYKVSHKLDTWPQLHAVHHSYLL